MFNTAFRGFSLSKIKDIFHFPSLYKTKNKIHDKMIEDLHFEEQRRINLPILKEHTTQTLNIKGQEVEIDKDMIPLVLWINDLKEGFTHFCCQGDVYNPDTNPFHQRPYISWSSNNPATVKLILKLFNDFYNIKEKYGDCYLPSTAYRYIETEVYWYENELRYTSRWFDNLALHDFILWAGNQELLTSHFKENHRYITQSWK